MTKNRMLLYCLLLVSTSSNAQVRNNENVTSLSAATGTIVSEMDKSIWVIFQDSKNNFWFGSNGSGAYCYDGKNIKQFTTKDGLIGNRIRGIQEDRSGNIYFDTPEGVSKFNGVKFTSLIPVKSSVNQWKLQPDDLWFKQNGDLLGAYRYDGKTMYLLEFSSISSKAFTPKHGVYSIYKDKQGFVWLGTLTEGVCRFDGTTLHWIKELEMQTLEDGRAPAIRSILEDKDGYFWFSNIVYQYKILQGSKKGIEYKKVKRIEMSGQKKTMDLPYYTSAVLDNENIWMTNYNEGVWKFDGKQLSHYPLTDNSGKVLVMFLFKDNSGTLWLATDNAGVYKFNGKTFEKFNPGGK